MHCDHGHHAGNTRAQGQVAVYSPGSEGGLGEPAPPRPGLKLWPPNCRNRRLWFKPRSGGHLEGSGLQPG